jgi:RNA polymerase sigma-70 factor (ECF subfamily)
MTERMPTRIAFEDMVDRYSGEIFGYLWRFFQGRPEAEDCLQETFLRAFRAYPRTPDLRNPRAWLYRIATNTARSHWARGTRQLVRTADLDARLPSPASSVPDLVDHRQRLRAVAAAVEALPPRQRAALLMRKYQELDYAAIADALECTEAAARANVYQALKKLRLQLALTPETERTS